MNKKKLLGEAMIGVMEYHAIIPRQDSPNVIQSTVTAMVVLGIVWVPNKYFKKGEKRQS